ncbi:MAG: hypothetical protein LBE13_22725 [Bacteroidales bacterium]|nr:hypothetical protein [Bacteroidales bacterium]
MPEWSTVRESLARPRIADILFKKLLVSLQVKDISAVVLKDLLEEWDIKNNEAVFTNINNPAYLTRYILYLEELKKLLESIRI